MGPATAGDNSCWAACKASCSWPPIGGLPRLHLGLIGGDATEIGNADVAAITSGDVTTAGAACADDMAIAFVGGGDTWTTTLSGGVAGTPMKS